jgi:DNA-binding MarR family transcriptional regulator
VPTPDIDRLENLLFRVYTAQLRPAWRNHVLAASPHDIGVVDLRLVRAIVRTTSDGRSPSVGELAQELGLEHSSTSRAVKGAESRGLVERTGTGNDRRRSHIALTDKGGAVLEHLTARRRHMVADMVAAWSTQDVGLIVDLLDRLADEFDVWLDS